MAYAANELFLAEQCKEAEQKYREVIQIDPKYTSAHNALGHALAAQGCFEEAIEHYRQAEALWQETGSADRKSALRSWGIVLEAQERFDDALAKFAEALELDPRDGDSVLAYGNALTNCG
jgi:tetratricopeptide (TPR) repeat protein